MANRLEGELLHRQKQLSGLIKDTEAAIGQVARHGYKEVNKISVGLPISGDIPQFQGDTRFFKARRLIQRPLVPIVPVLMDNQGEFTVTDTTTETYRRQHYSKGEPVLRLPIQNKLVVVEFSEPEKDHKRSVAVSPEGYALWESRGDYTYPRAVDRASLTSGYDGYSSGEALEADYADKFTGALVVTQFIADSLSRTHGIESDTKELKVLQEAWGRVAPVEMHPNIAVLLPKATR